VLVNIETDSTF